MEKITTKLPEEFLSEMKNSLGEDYQKYLTAMDEEPVRGLRVNTNRVDVADFIEKYGKPLEKIPFSRDGFVFESDE